ncbi:DUF4271 domain-containing protein [Mucilaginibacter sp. UR6-1]|uniref:DUF4271 domain-containing protein n=1 Tax=Mucilaginibacter sp. UR6-1 TaxID=1435643 RepID=UPI001E2B06A0|nr:DUF4271 domain-containing protein [Mucilaginibacter sp. UR6-1]MCC8410832.1 DUF4271 domain-containing protein [Mucilaginibacter sp. UR6-1]
MIRSLAILFFLTTLCGTAFAQTDSTETELIPEADTGYYEAPRQMHMLDSVAMAAKVQEQAVSDSLAMLYIKTPDPERRNQFVEQMLDKYLYKGYGFWDIKPASKATAGTGIGRAVRARWVIGVVVALLLYTGLLRLTIGRDVDTILRSAFKVQLFSQNDEGTPISFWTFTGLLILLGFTFGLFLYQLSVHYQVYYQLAGMALYFSLSMAVLLLFAFKIILLKFLGWVFAIKEVVERYITILCLTYFTVAILFLPIVVSLTLINPQLTQLVLLMALVIAGVILIWLYLRNSVIIISSFKFPKFYLFIYLCALEICPILILIKALNI